MEPVPDPQPNPEDFDDPDYFSYEWENLNWSSWVPFSASREDFLQIPKEPGLYRIRPAGRNFLMYIGETGQGIHKRLAELRQSLRRTDLMPWYDPHPAAPALWAWRDAEEFGYECSAAPFDASQFSRRGMESFLLCRYRQEYGGSPACNFLRFHPRYRMSSRRAENRRGGKLAEGQKDNPAGGPGVPPLAPRGEPGGPDWMGLAWSPITDFTEAAARAVPPGPGLFIISDAGTGEILAIGHAMDSADRLAEYRRKDGDGHTLRFSHHGIAGPVLPHNLRELETDLVGNYFACNRKAPEFQFRASR